MKKQPYTQLIMEPILEEVIEKTAKFVKERGPDFERQLLEDSQEKFGFILPEHPQHSLYRSLLAGDEDSKVPPTPVTPFQYSTYDVEGTIPSLDLEIIKRVAIFFVNCKSNNSDSDSDSDDSSILLKIRTELKDDPKYQFLDNGHTLHPTFLQFVTQYKSLNSPTVAQSQFEYLENCVQRARYEEYQQEKSQKDEEMNEIYKIRFAAVDWEVFKLVGKFRDLDASSLMEPLDFSRIARNEIFTRSKQEYLQQYFPIEEPGENTETNGDTEDVDANKIPTINNKAKKRKGKIIVKQTGETRIGKKKKKR